MNNSIARRTLVANDLGRPMARPSIRRLSSGLLRQQACASLGDLIANLVNKLIGRRRRRTRRYILLR